MNSVVEHSNTPAFRFMAWAAFMIASVGTLVGIVYLPTDVWVKGYLAMSYLFTVASCFTLAKTLRDQQEAERLVNRIKDARTEKLLTDYDKLP